MLNMIWTTIVEPQQLDLIWKKRLGDELHIVEGTMVSKECQVLQIIVYVGVQ